MNFALKYRPVCREGQAVATNTAILLTTAAFLHQRNKLDIGFLGLPVLHQQESVSSDEPASRGGPFAAKALGISMLMLVLSFAEPSAVFA